MAFDPNAGDVGPTNQTTDNSALLKQIAAALAAAGGGLAGHALSNSGGDPLTRAVPPQLSQLLDNSVARQGYQNPLFQATTQGAYAMLPTFAKTGTQLSGSLPSTLPPAAPTSGGGVNGGALAGGAGMAALAALLGKGGTMSSIINALKKLLGGGGNPGRKAPGPSGDGGSGLPSHDPFNSNNNGWNGFPTGDNGYNPSPNVNTDEFFNSWPETSDPFAPFDPSMLPGGNENSFPGLEKP